MQSKFRVLSDERTSFSIQNFRIFRTLSKLKYRINLISRLDGIESLLMLSGEGCNVRDEKGKKFFMPRKGVLILTRLLGRPNENIFAISGVT